MATCTAGLIGPVGDAPHELCGGRQEREPAYREPGAGRLASFGPENVNGVRTVVGVPAERVDASCAVAAC